MFLKKCIKKIKKSLFFNKNKANPLANIAYKSYITTRELSKRKDISLGRYVYGSPTVHSGYEQSKLIVGSFTCFAPGVVIFLASHHNPSLITTYPLSWLTSKKQGSLNSKGDVVIGNDVWIGQNTIILPGVKIGDGAVVGAGSIITKNVEPYSIVGGSPAKMIRKRFSDEEISMLEEMKWWEWSNDKISNCTSLLENDNVKALYNNYLESNSNR